MDLHSDAPFWLIKNGLLRCYPPLTDDVECDSVVIGGGITGALVADALTTAGLSVVVIDRREIAQGSTSASTALLQYEIDTHLQDLSRTHGEQAAVRAYRLCLDAIDEIQQRAEGLPDRCGFCRQPSLYFASSSRDVKILRNECELRASHGFPVTWCTTEEVRDQFQFQSLGGILSTAGGVVDPFQLTHGLFARNQERGLRVFDRTTVASWKSTSGGIELCTSKQARIRARTLVFACGYEAQSYLREKIVRLKSTYALVTGRDQPQWWKQNAMIWESARPYLYLRRTTDDRVLAGGEDDVFRSPALRESRLEYKTQRILARLKKMFPNVEIESEYAWGGTFGETKDGLGYIGPSPEMEHAYFALGFGGNGITFSVVAANILRDLITGRPNEDAHLFRFGR